MAKSYYLTTPIYYLNDSPHIGHAYTSIAADVVARFARLLGKKTYFLTGSDEHGQKVASSASKSGKSPEDFVDDMVKPYIELCRVLDLSNDDFIRTTEPRHREAVRTFWRKLQAEGQIYLDSYKGWYSVRQESFVTEFTLSADGTATAADGEKLEQIEEVSYFFRLSNWQKPLLRFYEQNPEAIAPPSRYNEVVSFIKGGLRDLSVSRRSLKWGVPVPDDPEHVMYVWIDALGNYLSAIRYPDPVFKNHWPADLHMMGKDILRFHAVYWPALLMAAGLEPPKRIFAHGWWTNEGRKISKSLGNVIDPFSMVEKWGADQLRYFLLAETPFGADGDWSKTALKNRINADLANGIGNLAMRSLTLIHRHFEGKPPTPPAQASRSEKALLEKAAGLTKAMEKEVFSQEFHLALARVMELVKEIDGYLTSSQPWKAVKTDKNRAGEQLAVALAALRAIAEAAGPFMPRAMAELRRQTEPGKNRRLPPPKALFSRAE